MEEAVIRGIITRVTEDILRNLKNVIRGIDIREGEYSPIIQDLPKEWTGRFLSGLVSLREIEDVVFAKYAPSISNLPLAAFSGSIESVPQEVFDAWLDIPDEHIANNGYVSGDLISANHSLSNPRPFAHSGSANGIYPETTLGLVRTGRYSTYVKALAYGKVYVREVCFYENGKSLVKKAEGN